MLFVLLSNKQVRRRWSARAQGNHFALAEGMEVGTVATGIPRNGNTIRLVYCIFLHPFRLRLICCFVFIVFCVRFAQLIWRLGAKPPTATFGNVTGCGRQMGSLALPCSRLSCSCVGRGERCICIYVVLACCHDRYASF